MSSAINHSNCHFAVRAHSSHLKVICRARPVVKSISGPHKQHFFRWSVQLARKVLQALPSIYYLRYNTGRGCLLMNSSDSFSSHSTDSTTIQSP